MLSARPADRVVDDIEFDRHPHVKVVVTPIQYIAFMEEEVAAFVVANVPGTLSPKDALDPTDHHLLSHGALLSFLDQEVME